MSKRYVGERILQKCGEYVEVQEILPLEHYTVIFENGVVRQCSEYALSNGLVPNSIRSKRYIGERLLQNCGDFAELIEFLYDDKCIVRFDSGVIKVCRLDSLLKGQISSTLSTRNSYTIGMKRMQNCGMVAEITELLPDFRCRVRFENGVEKECNRSSFKRGCISYKYSNRETYEAISIGDKVYQECGEYADVIKPLSNGRCIVRFDSGFIQNVSRRLFKVGKLDKVDEKSILTDKTTNGKIINKVYIGLKTTQNCGATSEVVELLQHGYVLVRFEDSSIVKCTRKALKYKSVVPYFLYRNRGVGAGRYRETKEPVLSMYFDNSLRSYVGVLRRNDGTRYVRVLGETADEQ